MKNIICFTILFLCPFVSSVLGQTKMKANQVSLVANGSTTTVQAAYGSAITNISVISNSISAVNSNLNVASNALNSQIQSVGSNVTALSVRVGTAETNITSLQTFTNRSLLLGTNIAGYSYSTSALTWSPNAVVGFSTVTVCTISANNFTGSVVSAGSMAAGSITANTIIASSLLASNLNAVALMAMSTNDIFINEETTTDLFGFDYTNYFNSSYIQMIDTNELSFQFKKLGTYHFYLTSTVVADGSSVAGYFEHGYSITNRSPEVFDNTMHRLSGTNSGMPAVQRFNYQRVWGVTDTNDIYRVSVEGGCFGASNLRITNITSRAYITYSTEELIND